MLHTSFALNPILGYDPPVLLDCAGPSDVYLLISMFSVDAWIPWKSRREFETQDFYQRLMQMVVFLQERVFKPMNESC